MSRFILFFDFQSLVELHFVKRRASWWAREHIVYEFWKGWHRYRTGALNGFHLILLKVHLDTEYLKSYTTKDHRKIRQTIQYAFFTHKITTVILQPRIYIHVHQNNPQDLDLCKPHQNIRTTRIQRQFVTVWLSRTRKRPEIGSWGTPNLVWVCFSFA